jgi:hypothetical protein
LSLCLYYRYIRHVLGSPSGLWAGCERGVSATIARKSTFRPCVRTVINFVFLLIGGVQWIGWGECYRRKLWLWPSIFSLYHVKQWSGEVSSQDCVIWGKKHEVIFFPEWNGEHAW